MHLVFRMHRLIFYGGDPMEQLHNGFLLDIPTGCFPLSTDSMLLSAFAKLPKQARVLDLGSGCGTLGVLLCASDPGCRITGIEIDERAHEAALLNIERNALADRMESICADVRSLSCVVPAGAFQVCLSNPPYYSGGPASLSHPTARREDACSPEDLFCAASHALKFGGDFFLVHRPEKLAQLIACGAKHGLETKQLQLVRHKEGGEITLILLSFRKGGKPGLKIEEAALFDKENNPTDFYKSVYHLK